MKYRSDNTSTTTFGGAAASPLKAKLKARAAKEPVSLFGVIAMTILTPILAGAAYLFGTQQEISIERVLSSLQLQEMNPPSSHVALPTIAQLPSLERGEAFHWTSSPSAPRPLHLVFNSVGHVESPFSFELDENGAEVSRTELKDVQAFKPALSRGPFDAVRNLSEITLPKDFVVSKNAKPFAFTETERFRLSNLRNTSPELKSFFSSAERTISRQIAITPTAVKSLRLDVKPLKDPHLKEALADLSWIRTVSIYGNLSGDNRTQARILNVLRLWVSTYQSSGYPLEETPLLDAILAYDFVRDDLKDTEKLAFDNFFRNIAQAQFVRAAGFREYDLEHAAHTLFTLTVGFTLNDGPLQYYGISQYHAHIDNSVALLQDTYGEVEVETMSYLLRAAYILERAENASYKSDRLLGFCKTLANASQTRDPQTLMSAVGLAAYFKPELYTRLASLNEADGSSWRLGSANSALIAAVRKPTSSLEMLKNENALRVPAGRPLTLPPKLKRRLN